MVGRTVAHYRILKKLGEGGMGVVYKALDTHLDRFVALKLLPPEKVADPDRKHRFVQEAKTASALNHPNIITVHDISQADGVTFIAMECVEGNTLGQLIGRKGLELSDALRYGIQIAGALAKAHAAGIVHRDLKPSNIMVTGDGLVKVLDFGLAKLTERVSGELAETQTMTAHTQEGGIVGTLAYMSPEQAQGKPVDARSDIFSFGAVLYEMVTGRRAFQGDKKISTLAAVINQEPPPAGLEIPRDLERIITRCLRKDPDRRFHHMIDLKVALEELKEESDSGALPTGLAPPRRRRSWPVAVVAIAAPVAVIAAILLWRKAADTPAQTAISTRLTADSGFTTDPALSPDGKLVAYASDRAGAGNLDIWIQNLSSGEAHRLTEDPADERGPSFSPDGSRIVFRSEKDGGGIFTIAAFGGEPRLVAKGRAPRYSPDGSRIAYHVGGAEAVGGLEAELEVVPASGGTPRRIETQLTESWNPLWTPDGKHLLFLGLVGRRQPEGEKSDWWVVPAGGGPAVPTGAFEALRRAGFKLEEDDAPVPAPGAWLDNSVIFSGQVRDSRNLWRLAISRETWKATGAPERLTFGTNVEAAPTVAVVSEGGGRSIRLAFASLVFTLNIYDLPVDANRGEVLANEPRRLTSSAYDVQSSLSADGKRLAFVSTRSGNRDIWLKDLESGKETALTFTSIHEFGPAISPDGSKVGYAVVENDRWDFFLLPIGRDGKPGLPERVCEDCPRVWDFSSDGKRLLFGYEVGVARMSIGLFDLESRQKTELIKHPQRFLARARFSPDDRWISFHALTSRGRSRVQIVPFRDGTAPSPDQWIAITDDESFHDKPVWSPDGNLLYFTSDRDGFRCVWAQRLDPATKQPAGPPIEIHHSHGARRSLLNAGILPLELHVAPGRLVFHLGEITGNIWMAKLEGK
jgi:serine/threonine protein kinase